MFDFFNLLPECEHHNQNNNKSFLLSPQSSLHNACFNNTPSTPAARNGSTLEKHPCNKLNHFFFIEIARDVFDFVSKENNARGISS